MSDEEVGKLERAVRLAPEDVSLRLRLARTWSAPVVG